jgi:hypothetical protein
MRGLLPAFTVCLLLAGASATWHAPAQGTPATPATPAAPAAPAAPAKLPAAAGSTADNDAAARHAKRTACIKEARAKKLVGAQKTAYIKECAASPPTTGATGAQP